MLNRRMLNWLTLASAGVTAASSASANGTFIDYRQTGRSELFPDSVLVWSDHPGRYQSSHVARVNADGVLQTSGRFDWDIGPRSSSSIQVQLSAWKSDVFVVTGGLIDNTWFRLTEPCAFRISASASSDSASLGQITLRAPGSTSAISSPEVDHLGRITLQSSTAGTVLSAGGHLAAGDYEIVVSAGIGQLAMDWTLEVPACDADYDQSFEVSVQDLFVFLGSFFAGEFRADFNHSQTLTVQDVFDFLAAYFQGC